MTTYATGIAKNILKAWEFLSLFGQESGLWFFALYERLASQLHLFFLEFDSLCVSFEARRDDIYFFREVKMRRRKTPRYILESLQSFKLRHIAEVGLGKSNFTQNLLSIDAGISLTWLYADK